MIFPPLRSVLYVAFYERVNPVVATFLVSLLFVDGWLILLEVVSNAYARDSELAILANIRVFILIIIPSLVIE